MPQALTAYLDIPTFQAMGLGLDVSGLLGLNTILTSPANIGDTTLNVVSSGGVQKNQLVYILDGPKTEIVLASNTTPAPTNASVAIQAPGLAYAHSARASVSGGGTSGTLAQVILAASGWIESECRQGTTVLGSSLFSKSVTERIKMPTMRGCVDSSGALAVSPHFFPITAVSSVSIETSPGSSTGALDVTQVELDSTGRMCVLPVVQTTSISANLWGPPIPRSKQAWCVITYTAGLTSGALPWDFQQAVAFAIQEFDAYAENPTGAVRIRQESVEVIQRFIGRPSESTADGIFLLQAKSLLKSYRAQAM